MSSKYSDINSARLSFQYFSWIDYSIFMVMLSVCCGIGIYFGFVKRQTSTNDYLMGGRNMKLVPICFSLVASFISGISLLGTPTEIYLYGTSYVFTIIGALIMSFVVITTFIPVFHELQLTSAYEYLELRYDKRTRVFGSVLFSVYLIAWLPIVIYVPALAFNQVTGVNIHVVSPIVCLVCIFYTSLGGLKAVVWTDVVQTVVMFGAMLIVIIKGTIIVGGVEELFDKSWTTNRIELPSFNFDLTERHTIWSVTIGSTFYWIGNIAVNQSMMQRFLALSDVKKSKWAVWGFLFGVFLIILTCSYSGLLAYARYYKCDPLNSKLVLAKDQLLPLLVMDVLSEWKGMPGVFVAGVFSAALSSLSTGLNSMAAVVLEDFWKPFFKKLSQKQTQILVRTVVVVLGCVCVGLVFVVEKLGSVLQLTMSLSSASMGPLAGIFLMGLFLPFVNGVSALTGGISGLIIAWWVAAQSQLAQARGLLRFKEKDRYTFNCTYAFEAVTDVTNDDQEEVSYIYRISYLWFTALGCSVTVIVACLVSLRSSKVKNDHRLFAPFLRSWLMDKKEVDEINLKNTPRRKVVCLPSHFIVTWGLIVQSRVTIQKPNRIKTRTDGFMCSLKHSSSPGRTPVWSEDPE
ncbi:sodium-coupled monocarboxylate transporter 1-like [Melitaea cinxia]|uniref:sodium-coupled monocarboxylate transporter 1-like n=1 Tax=Melitaea cinxia TaxID=113334 RepID=UPI001E273893|nr:sodium-coupled monocarboxylate transporter 1-like [Melitaea cinxia]